MHIIIRSFVFPNQSKNPGGLRGKFSDLRRRYRNRDIYSYPAQLQELLGNPYEVGNFGRNGVTLLSRGHRPYIQQEEFKKALEFQPDLVVIHLGLNDTDPRNWPMYGKDFIRDYAALIMIKLS